MFSLHLGDSLEVLKSIKDNSIDSVVTDPPYGLAFMNKKWDCDVPSVELWREVLRVLKPGGHLLSFGGTRTYHRMVVSIEDAGFEIRDQLQWLYGSGFPKSHNISKSVAKINGDVLEVVGSGRSGSSSRAYQSEDKTTAGNYEITKANNEWDGWGTALKPAFEPLVYATKPLTGAYLLSSLVHECQLLLYAEIAKSLLRFNLSESTQQSIVQWSAGKSTLTRGALSEVTAMLQSESETNSSLNTVFSWLNTLEEIFQQGSTFTTEMESSLTIDLKTLNYLLSKNTQENIIQAETSQNGQTSNALPVANLFNGLSYKLNFILKPSAQEPVTSSDGPLKSLQAAATNNEPIVLARKPLEKGLTIAENVLKWGTGALNIDECRIEGVKPKGSGSSSSFVSKRRKDYSPEAVSKLGRFPANLILDETAAEMLDEQSGISKSTGGDGYKNSMFCGGKKTGGHGLGDVGGASRFFYVAKASKRERYVALTCSCKAVKPELWERQGLSQKDQTVITSQLKDICERQLKESLSSVTLLSGKNITANYLQECKSITLMETLETIELITCKWSHHLSIRESIQAVKKEMESGLSHALYAKLLSLLMLLIGIYPEKGGHYTGVAVHATLAELLRKSVCEGCGASPKAEGHPTQKPIKLMRYLCRLITPPNGTVLDPFTGSGSTGVAAIKEGFSFVGIEREKEYLEIAKRRINHAQQNI